MQEHVSLCHRTLNYTFLQSLVWLHLFPIMCFYPVTNNFMGNCVLLLRSYILFYNLQEGCMFAAERWWKQQIFSHHYHTLVKKANDKQEVERQEVVWNTLGRLPCLSEQHHGDNHFYHTLSHLCSLQHRYLDNTCKLRAYVLNYLFPIYTHIVS